MPTCTPTSTGTPTPSPEPDGIAASRAWIAGAVLGPVAALALGVIWFWVYRRRNKEPRGPAEVEGYATAEPTEWAPKPPDAELDTNHNVTELPSPPRVAELESETTIAELESPPPPQSDRHGSK